MLVTLTTAKGLANETDVLTALLLTRELLCDHHICHMCRYESGLQQTPVAYEHEGSVSMGLHLADLETRVCFEE